jgi:hypothetical protein
MYVIYRGQKISILRRRDLDEEFSRRELWEYLKDVREQRDIYDLEARGLPKFVYVAWYSHLSANPLKSDL